LTLMIASHFSGGLVDRRDVLDAGVVDDDVEPAERALRLAHHGGDLLAAGDVGGRVADLDARSPGDLAPDALDLVGVAKAIQGDVGTSFCERAGDREADAAGGAGHERGLADKLCSERRHGGASFGVARGRAAPGWRKSRRGQIAETRRPQVAPARGRIRRSAGVSLRQPIDYLARHPE
jgi:hypothetical protein